MSTTDSLFTLLDMPLAAIPAAAIFDCDGTLADTMPLHYRMWRETLDGLGATLPVFPETQFYAWGGVTAREIIVRLNAEHHPLNIDPDTIAALKEENFRRNLGSVKPIELVVAEARRLAAAGCRLAVASGGRRDVVQQTIRSIGLGDLVETVVGAEDVLHGKPAPDVFLLAASRLGVAPAACVVFEDGASGIEAARRAGMQAVDVTRYL